MSEEATKAASGELPSNLVSEFFVLFFGRLIPGSIAAYLFIDHRAFPKEAFLEAFGFFCVAWIIGAALDLTSHQICLWLCRKLLDQPAPAPQYERTEWKRFDPRHTFPRELPNDKRRRIDWFYCDKVVFRSMFVISLFVAIIRPPNWPLFLEGRFWYGLLGAVASAICWRRQQFALNDEEFSLASSPPRP
jgi:hypothetical protein